MQRALAASIRAHQLIEARRLDEAVEFSVGAFEDDGFGVAGVIGVRALIAWSLVGEFHTPADLAFPNVDVTAHLFRAPETEWIGFDTTVSYGPRRHGLTQTVVHDELGPIGTVQQTLTLRD